MTEINLSKIKAEKPINELLKFCIFNIDKPSGPTSFWVDVFVKNKLNASKASHFGTLDPKVTGVLPIAVNRACKLSDYFMHKNKTYVGVMRIHKELDEEKLRKEMDKFTGKIKQLPPIKSRVKREVREREVFSFKILEKNGQDILFQAEVEAGTYIRKLCLHPNTEIITPSEIIKIKDFCAKPSEIYSYNKGKLELKKLSETQKIAAPNKLIKLKMSSGINIVATLDHKMFVSRNRGYEMIECEKLKIGDYIIKASYLPFPTKNYSIADLLDDDYLIEDNEIKEKCKRAMIKKFGSIRAMNRKLKLDRKAFLSNSRHAISIKHLKLVGIYDEVKDGLKKFKTQKGTIIEIDKLTKEHFYLLGLISSDGNNTREKKTKRFTRLKFHNINEELINIFLEIYEKIFPSIKISKRFVQNRIFQLDTSNSLFASIAANLGVVSPNKYSDILPILYYKDEFIKAFLRGYFDGDGTAYFKKKNNSTTTHSNISFFSVNYINAKRIHQMLLKLNINSRILLRKKWGIYVININSISSKKKFIEEIGANHPRKKAILEKISKISRDSLIGDENYIGLHYKEIIEKNRSKLSKMGGNLHRVLNCEVPITKGFYRKCFEIIDLPNLDDFIIEKIEEIELVDSEGENVFDMTIPETHNFLIETGFVSSNCSDLGEQIGGAHMSELRRIKAGIFEEKDIVNLYEFEKAVDAWKAGDESKLRKIIIPGEIISQILPVVEIKKQAIKALYTGKFLDVKQTDKNSFNVNERFAGFSGEVFIGVYNADSQILAKPEFVLTKI